MADERFLTSTSLCICGVRSLNGRNFAAGKVPGPVTHRLTEAHKQLVNCDFVAQYLRQLTRVPYMYGMPVVMNATGFQTKLFCRGTVGVFWDRETVSGGARIQIIPRRFAR